MLKLEIIDFVVRIANKSILNKINLSFSSGDIIGILGPNGHGKSTLLKSIMNHYDTFDRSGKILLNNENLNDLSTDLISKKGIFLSQQYPEEIHGILYVDFLKLIINSNQNEKINLVNLYNKVEPILKKLKLDRKILKRSLNENFSGGEKKKSEILQMLLLNPNICLLDEIDSGLDTDSLKIINDEIKSWFNENKILIIVSHNEKIFKELIPNKVIVLVNGEVKEIGDKSIIDEVSNKGYKKWLKK